MNAAKWVVAAEQSGARIYRFSPRDGHLTLIKEFLNPYGKSQESDLGSDSPGRSFESRGFTRHALVKHTNTSEVRLKAYVSELAEYLKMSRHLGKYEELTLIAAPRLLGTLRASLDQPVKKCVVKEVPKEIPLWLSDDYILQNLRNEMRVH